VDDAAGSGGIRGTPTAQAVLRHYWTISSSEGDRNPIVGAAVCSTTICPSPAMRSFSGSSFFKSETSTSAFSCSIFSSKNGLIGHFDPIDIVAHVVERSATETRFAAIRFALADLVGKPRHAVEQPLRQQLKMLDLHVQVFEMEDQRVRLLLDIGLLGAEQLRLDRVKAQ